MLILIGRGGGIRTPDPLLPKQMRYQTALRPDDAFMRLNAGYFFDCTARGIVFGSLGNVVVDERGENIT
jgi:hypothetical protein